MYVKASKALEALEEGKSIRDEYGNIFCMQGCVLKIQGSDKKSWCGSSRGFEQFVCERYEILDDLTQDPMVVRDALIKHLEDHISPAKFSGNNWEICVKDTLKMLGVEVK